MSKPKFALRHADGRYYSFAGGNIYDGPQFSKDWRNAKLMTIQGATSVQKRLASKQWHGERFELVPQTEITGANP